MNCGRGDKWCDCATCKPKLLLYMFCTDGDKPAYARFANEVEASAQAEKISKREPGKQVSFGRVFGHYFTPAVETTYRSA